MSNDRLRAALSQAGLTGDELAELVKVDERTVRRWLAGLTPHKRRRVKVAKVLGKAERELWPDAEPELRSDADRGDLVTIHTPPEPARVPNWRSLLERASEKIELYDWSVAGLLAYPDVPALLTGKARAGTAIRILVASLESLWLSTDDVEPDTDGSRPVHDRPLFQAIERAHELLSPLAAESRVEALQVVAPRSPSILRFDEQILAAVHLWGSSPAGPVVFCVQHRGEDGPFHKLCDHFDALWTRAWPLHQSRREDPADYAGSGSVASTGQDDGRGWRRRAVLTPYGRRPPRRRS